MESPSYNRKAAFCGGGGTAAGPAHAGPPQLQVPAPATEAGEAD